METTTDYNDNFPGILDLLRVMVLISLFGLMACLESSAQVPNKTCCNPLHQVDIQQVRQFLGYLDSINYREESEQYRSNTRSNKKGAVIMKDTGSTALDQIVSERTYHPNSLFPGNGYMEVKSMLPKTVAWVK